MHNVVLAHEDVAVVRAVEAVRDLALVVTESAATRALAPSRAIATSDPGRAPNAHDHAHVLPHVLGTLSCIYVLFTIILCNLATAVRFFLLPLHVQSMCSYVEDNFFYLLYFSFSKEAPSPYLQYVYVHVHMQLTCKFIFIVRVQYHYVYLI